jgi:hypothetical protein
MTMMSGSASISSELENDTTDVMCTRCGSRMTCTSCETCDVHCLERDAVKCALLIVKETSYLGHERSERAVEQLAWALQAQKGMTAAAAGAAAEKLVRD